MRLFPLSNQVRLTVILGCLSAYAVALLAFRMEWTGKITYIFLVWNLFLAWIPFGLAQLLPVQGGQSRRAWAFMLILPAWLLFFPNAPYILTDLVHLKARHGVPFWFDLMLIMSFAFTGLLLGWLSLSRVQSYLRLHFRPLYTWAFVGLSVFLCGFGIYLGRVLRWNSWDVLTNPKGLMKDVLAPLLYPSQHLRTIAVSVLFASFLLLGYILVRFLMEGRLGTQQEGQHP